MKIVNIIWSVLLLHIGIQKNMSKMKFLSFIFK